MRLPRPPARALPLIAIGLFALAGCLSPAPSAEPGASASDPVSAPLPPAAQVTASPVPPEEVASSPTPSRQLHLRIVERGVLLYSSWPLEGGSLQQGTHAADRPPLQLPNETEIPEVVAPLYDLWASTPPGSTVTVEGYQPPRPEVEALTIPHHFHVARTGIIPSHEALDAFGSVRPAGIYRFSDTLQLEILSWTDEGVHYRIPIDAPVEWDVARTRGLTMRLEPEGDDLLVTLTAPQGGFTSLGCRPVPGTAIPPGYYQITGWTPDAWQVERYQDKMDFDLMGRTLTITAAILAAATE